jgi:hypothetical protein
MRCVGSNSISAHTEGAKLFCNHEPRESAKKSPAKCGAFSSFTYLLRPEPEPVGPSVDPLGEPLGPSVLPDGFTVLFGPVVAPMFPEPVARPVALPLMDEPVVVPLAAEPPAVELPPAEPLPLLCASANVLDSAKAVARAMVVSFMVDSSSVDVEEQFGTSILCSDTVA